MKFVYNTLAGVFAVIAVVGLGCLKACSPGPGALVSWLFIALAVMGIAGYIGFRGLARDMRKPADRDR